MKTTTAEDPLLQFYHSVANAVNPNFVTERTVVPPDMGKGLVTCLRIDTGICAGFYDLDFYEDQYFSFPANKINEGNNLFRLVFSLGADHDPTQTPDNPFWITKNKTSFYSINFNRTAFLPKQRRYRSVDIIFSKQWLELNYQTKSERIGKLIQVLASKKDPTLLLELLDRQTYIIAGDISSRLHENNISLLCIKAEIFTLLNNFFQKATQRSQRNIKKNQALYYETIKEVEKSLAKYYTEELPNISTLAKEFNISVSTLKRHFKNIFNKNIYDYYLEQKMALGMAMLEEKRSSVSEVAYRLGYQKVNSFSKIFKKHFGILPSEFD